MWIYTYMVKEYEHTGKERSTDWSREEWVWGDVYYVLLKKDPKQIWKNVKNLDFVYTYKGVTVIISSVCSKYFIIKH